MTPKQPNALTEEQFLKLLKPGVLFLYEWGTDYNTENSTHYQEPYLLVEVLNPSGQWRRTATGRPRDLTIQTVTAAGKRVEGCIILSQVAGIYDANGLLIKNPSRDKP